VLIQISSQLQKYKATR